MNNWIQYFDELVQAKKCADCGKYIPWTPSFHHICTARAKKAYYFYVMGTNDEVVRFAVINHNDPDQYVETVQPDGVTVRWIKFERNGILFFEGPRDYDIRLGLGWCYDGRLQKGEQISDELLDKLQLNNRVSVVFNCKAKITNDLNKVDNAIIVPINE